ncbi:MAG: TonB-dependent receptor [Sphingobacteriia bacterium 39-39-8]|nr:MAG: TonB-dependent receptor [Sphingobacteriia bacterium 39-39-8]HQR92941.1 TonB-dependent receptor [Sediminibacterium sp.]
MKQFFFNSLLYAFAASLYCGNISAQETVVVKQLDSVFVQTFLPNKTWLPETSGTFLYSGKKTETVSLIHSDVDLSSKIGRQLFSKIPGVFVYDMDGSGNQVNIATRGLDPHRGWDLNIRKDGVLTNSDMYGYPASHYSMPMESIDRIELVRGTGSLQYGAQFGGMLNYVNKRADSAKIFGFESINTVGSYQLISSYNAIGGQLGKFKYYAYLYRKSKTGYRENESTSSQAENLMLEYSPTKAISIKLEWARSTYLYRIPGPLSDPMFLKDPRMSSKNRNYFSPEIHVPSLNIDWQINAGLKLQFIASAVLGSRNSVMYDKAANVLDTINAATGQFNHRQVDIDNFNSYTYEMRFLNQFQIFGKTANLVSGLQYMNNDLHRRQLGIGTTGSDYSLELVNPAWGRDLHFKTKNLAIFAEGKVQFNQQLSVTAGLRYEQGISQMSGQIGYYPIDKIPFDLTHQFPLLGAGIQYQWSKQAQFYAGWSQSYRPMIFKDLIPGSVYETIDPFIKDVKGDNSELGFRGSWKSIKWDLTAFILREFNRFGTIAGTDGSGVLYTYRTNIGNSISKGLELFIQWDQLLSKNAILSIFTSSNIMRARYVDANVKQGSKNTDISGNKVESAPDLTFRNGLTIRLNKFSTTVLYSYTAETFADPLNTVIPTPGTGAVGLVPAYGLLDLNASWQFSKTFNLKLNLNNITDKQYFTKRPLFYPGPGIWSSDGRNFSCSIGIKL